MTMANSETSTGEKVKIVNTAIVFPCYAGKG